MCYFKLTAVEKSFILGVGNQVSYVKFKNTREMALLCIYFNYVETEFHIIIE